MVHVRVAYVTTFCPHYRVRTYETLARHHDLTYYFFSGGEEWYWLDEHGVRDGQFRHKYLPGFNLGRTRVTPKLPQWLWENDYDVYIKCINGRFALPATYAVARIRRKPFILWTGIWSRLRTPAQRFLFPLTRYIYRHADAIAVYGKHVKRYLISEGVPPERIFVAQHAVDNELYGRTVTAGEVSALRRSLGIVPDRRVILYLGRLVEEKGLPYLIQAFASLQSDDTVLVMAGAGIEQESLQALAANLGLADRVLFPGYIQPEATVAFYRMAHVYVLPSVTTPYFREPWGLVVNEAFNQGTPVIATESVGAAAGGLVQDRVNGFVVEERNTPALAQALQTLLTDEALRHRMSQNALSTIAGWNNERMVKGFRDAIDYVAAAE